MDKYYLYVTPFFPTPTSWRGAYGYDFVKTLKRQMEVEGTAGGEQWNVLVFMEGDGRDYEIGGVKVHTFRARRLPSNIFPNLFARSNQRAFLAAVKRAGVKVEDVAVCHGNTANYGIYPLALKRENPKCKTLLHHHDLASFGLNMGALRRCWLYNLIQFPILRRMHGAIDTHVFISEASRRSFLAAPDAEWTEYADYKKQTRGLRLLRFRPTCVKRSVVLHNGVDTSLFSPSQVTSRAMDPQIDCCVGAFPRNAQERTFTIGCVGNFIDLKDQGTVIRACGKLRQDNALPQGLNVRVVFVGSGPLLERCKHLAAEVSGPAVTAPVAENGDGTVGSMAAHAVCFEFLPEVRHEELPAFYRSLDLFVLPSYFEGFGCVYTEAWACGVPFIACEGQGIGDLIAAQDRHLWLCKPRDPVDLAAKIKYYIQNRPKQRLTGPIDINELTKEFFQKICE